MARTLAAGLEPATYPVDLVRHELREVPSIAGGIRLVDEQGQPATHAVTVRVTSRQHCAVNHQRRMKRLGARRGVEAMFAYTAQHELRAA